MELSFKDANGVELKPGDTVLRAIGSQFVERVITSITFSAAVELGEDGKTLVPTFHTYVKTKGKGRNGYWKGNAETYYRKGKLYTNDSCKVIKKAAA